MTAPESYFVIKPMHALCRLANVNFSDVLLNAGLPETFVTDHSQAVSAAQAFAFWTSLCDASSSEALPLELGVQAAHIQIVPALLAYQFSKDIKSGLKPLAAYKRATGPYELKISDESNGMRIEVKCSVPELSLPPGLPTFEMVYMMELLRVSTAHPIKAVSVSLPELIAPLDVLTKYFGVKPHVGPSIEMFLSTNDANRTLVTENASLWHTIENALKTDLRRASQSLNAQARVQAALVKLLPAGKTSIVDVASFLTLTPRSLQRLLKSENTSFAIVREELRQGLAFEYLSQPDISIDEISSQLGYGDPNSFYRGFKRWTGLTPLEARSRMFSA